MSVSRVHQYRRQLSACLILRFQIPNLHEVCVVVNNHQAILQTVRRGDVDMTPQVTREMLEWGCWLARCFAILRCSDGLIQVARFTSDIIYRAWHNMHIRGIMCMLSLKALHVQMTHPTMPQGSVTLSSKCDRYLSKAVYLTRGHSRTIM
jgi:predicted ferric reductase